MGMCVIVQYVHVRHCRPGPQAQAEREDSFYQQLMRLQRFWKVRHGEGCGEALPAQHVLRSVLPCMCTCVKHVLAVDSGNSAEQKHCSSTCASNYCEGGHHILLQLYRYSRRERGEKCFNVEKSPERHAAA